MLCRSYSLVVVTKARPAFSFFHTKCKKSNFVLFCREFSISLDIQWRNTKKCILFTDKPTSIDAESLIEIKSARFSSDNNLDLEKVTPGSEILLQLEIESYFPQDLPIHNLAVSLSHLDVPTSNNADMHVIEEENVARPRSRVPRVAKQRSNA